LLSGPIDYLETNPKCIVNGDLKGYFCGFESL